MSIIIDGTTGITLPATSTIYNVTQIQSAAPLTAPLIKDSNSVEIGRFAKAWINFAGAATPTIRGSFNVSSITDGGTGIYTLNFTTAMPDVNYCVLGTTIAQVLSSLPVRVTAKQSALTTTSCLVRLCSGNQDGPNTVGGYSDTDSIYVAVFR